MVILGISYDTPDDNLAWAETHRFPFQLLSDEDRSVAAAYGAAREPGDASAGRPRRITYVVDSEGVIRLSYRVASGDIAGHADRVLADVAERIRSTGDGRAP